MDCSGTEHPLDTFSLNKNSGIRHVQLQNMIRQIRAERGIRCVHGEGSDKGRHAYAGRMNANVHLTRKFSRDLLCFGTVINLLIVVNFHFHSCKNTSGSV